MSISNIHWVAVLVSGLVGIASGAIWFGPKTFYPVWLKAMGKPENNNPSEAMNMGVVFGSTFVAQFVQAIALALILSSMTGLNMGKGALDGLVAGIGIAATSSLGHRLFGRCDSRGMALSHFVPKRPAMGHAWPTGSDLVHSPPMPEVVRISFHFPERAKHEYFNLSPISKILIFCNLIGSADFASSDCAECDGCCDPERYLRCQRRYRDRAS